MTLQEATPGNQYQVAKITTNDPELEDFLLTLGCFQGETISLVSASRTGYTVAIRDGRYNIDQNLAQAITLAE